MKFWYTMALLLVGAVFISSAAGTGMTLSALLDMPARIWEFSVQMVGGVAQVPDEEAREDWSLAFDAMLESVAIAWVGTVVGALFSLPCGILAARNMTPLSIYIPMRFILSVIRAVPELVFAVAIFIPCWGRSGADGRGDGKRLRAGHQQHRDPLQTDLRSHRRRGPRPLEASTAAGATHVQRIRWAVLPQVLPEVLAIWLYRFEVNIRASAILGALGAGGIGRLISPPNGLFGQRPYDWEAIGITLFVIIVITMAVDQISGFVRHRVIHGAKVRQRKSAKPGDGAAPDTSQAAAVRI
ncbi:phosphonate ABC transporter, permease protein PhnE [Nesterenkonia pannonica]|uniref:PhnE/PtxC family ABC transporter permease n=1 Tax=Nesterenkonia pannonica TaxID=1548602 RepID=UPI002164D441|nr:ABC transporter permease subunit [Nesterenkonia pannonica]